MLSIGLQNEPKKHVYIVFDKLENELNNKPTQQPCSFSFYWGVLTRFRPCTAFGSIANADSAFFQLSGSPKSLSILPKGIK
jgi:hypothetical protein